MTSDHAAGGRRGQRAVRLGDRPVASRVGQQRGDRGEPRPAVRPGGRRRRRPGAAAAGGPGGDGTAGADRPGPSAGHRSGGRADGRADVRRPAGCPARRGPLGPFPPAAAAVASDRPAASRVGRERGVLRGGGHLGHRLPGPVLLGRPALPVAAPPPRLDLHPRVRHRAAGARTGSLSGRAGGTGHGGVTGPAHDAAAWTTPG